LALALLSSAIEQYRQGGVLFPLDVLGADEVQQAQQLFEAMEFDHGGRLQGRMNQKPHLLYPWLNQLIRHPAIVDPVQSLLGPDLLCWSAQFFAKNARDPSYVSWHQDATYWGLSSPDVVTAWLAFTPSTIANGCMQVVPGTHHEQVGHQDTFAQDNLLSRGQEIAVQVDQSQVVNVELQPGQMSLHHVLLFHGSEPNPSDIRRIGFAIRYVPTHVRQLNGLKDYATLVRGQDDYGHFELEQAPQAPMHPDAVAHHKQVLDHQLSILYTGATQTGKLGNTIQKNL
jgi:non-haem Fe2+, alpha-ketoglutarate-dependent halogenase